MSVGAARTRSAARPRRLLAGARAPSCPPPATFARGARRNPPTSSPPPTWGLLTHTTRALWPSGGTTRTYLLPSPWETPVALPLPGPRGEKDSPCLPRGCQTLPCLCPGSPRLPSTHFLPVPLSPGPRVPILLPALPAHAEYAAGLSRPFSSLLRAEVSWRCKGSCSDVENGDAGEGPAASPILPASAARPLNSCEPVSLSVTSYPFLSCPFSSV